MTGKVLCKQYNENDTVSDYNTLYGETIDVLSTNTKSHKTQRICKGRKAKDADELAETKEKKKKKKRTQEQGEASQSTEPEKIKKKKARGEGKVE